MEDWDSIMHVEFVLAVENEFDVRLTGSEVAKCTWVSRIIKIRGQHQSLGMIASLAAGSRFIELENAKVRGSEYFDPALHELLDRALGDFAHFHGVLAEDVLADYLNFVRSYSKDLKTFWKEGKYPLELEEAPRPIERISYDVALIVSTLVSIPRFRIMKEIAKICESGDLGKVALVGIGPGLELDIVREHAGGSELIGFDPNVSGFAEQRFGREIVRAEIFDGGPPVYDYIFAIELLEHLEDPDGFVEACHSALKSGGRFVCTTAVNMPQFDHVTNFDDARFEGSCAALGFEQSTRLDLEHHYMVPSDQFAAKNVFYTLQKFN
jgi:hypothetical protein